MTAMYVKALLVSREHIRKVDSEEYRVFKKYLKRVFKSYDHLLGFVEGYGFGKIEIISIEDLEKKFENGTLISYHVFFVKYEKL